jgi:hypothetical protein
MIESLDTIRTLGLAPVFEDLYFGREVPGNLQIYMRYPTEFRNATLDEWSPLTEGGRLVPIVDDGNFYNICLFDSWRRKFVVKSVEEPKLTVREFDSWQQYLAYTLLEIGDSGASENELIQVAEIVGFRYTAELLSFLGEMETLSDSEIDERAVQFIRACAV